MESKNGEKLKNARMTKWYVLCGKKKIVERTEVGTKVDKFKT